MSERSGPLHSSEMKHDSHSASEGRPNMKRSIMVLGQPDSGKSNYLARLWESLRSGTGELELIDALEIKYLEEILAHLLQGEFVPRSDKSIEASEHDITLVARHKGRKEEVEIIVPDVTGELWRDAVTNADLPEKVNGCWYHLTGECWPHRCVLVSFGRQTAVVTVPLWKSCFWISKEWGKVGKHAFCFPKLSPSPSWAQFADHGPA